MPETDVQAVVYTYVFPWSFGGLYLTVCFLVHKGTEYEEQEIHNFLELHRMREGSS